MKVKNILLDSKMFDDKLDGNREGHGKGGERMVPCRND